MSLTKISPGVGGISGMKITIICLLLQAAVSYGGTERGAVRMSLIVYRKENV